MEPTLLTALRNPTTRTSEPMDAAQEAHLKRLQDRIAGDLDAKYRAGQLEHGGDLWMKPGMLEAAIAETLDLCVYLYTLLEQREAGFRHNGRDE